jgi:hypothetical protein
VPNKSNFLPISIWPKSAKLKCGIVCIRVFIERDKIFLLILVSIYLLLLLLLRYSVAKSITNLVMLM